MSPSQDSTEGRDLQELHGRPILVRSARDRRNPPVAVYGWIEVGASTGNKSAASVVIEFPQMFTSNAHRRTIPLPPAEVKRLLTSASAALDITLDEIDPPPA